MDMHVATTMPAGSSSTSTTSHSATSTDATTTACEPHEPAVLNMTAILVTVGVVCSLALVYLIVSVLRRFYRPIRPKIKKTFVVHNKSDRKNRTPLTCRPAPEQCEITIENCCNMNICDTVSARSPLRHFENGNIMCYLLCVIISMQPCFDPKAIQQEMNKDAARKDDRYTLLGNMEGDLY